MTITIDTHALGALDRRIARLRLLAGLSALGAAACLGLAYLTPHGVLSLAALPLVAGAVLARRHAGDRAQERRSLTRALVRSAVEAH